MRFFRPKPKQNCAPRTDHYEPVFRKAAANDKIPQSRELLLLSNMRTFLTRAAVARSGRAVEREQRGVIKPLANRMRAGVREYAVMAFSGVTLDPVLASLGKSDPHAVRLVTMGVTLSSPAKRKTHHPL